MKTIAGTRQVGGRVELVEDLSYSPLYNSDLAPTSLARRTWSTWNIAALWVGMAVCIPTYMLASSLMMAGLSWWQAVLAVFLGNLIVYVPLALNGHAGAKYGIPFPVLLRAPFGTRGANLPALLRAAVACGWFGIQTWIGGAALYMLAGVFAPHIKDAPVLHDFLGINQWQLISFLGFWAVNVVFILAGTESIKWLETLTAPLLLAIGVGLLGWGVVEGGGLRRILESSSNFTRPTVSAVRDGGEVVITTHPVRIDGKPRADRWRAAEIEKDLAAAPWGRTRLRSDAKRVVVEFQDAGGRSAKVTAPVREAGPSGSKPFWMLFLSMVTAMVGFWATLSLNIPDFTRYARNQKAQALGQAIGLPPTMAFYSFIGVAVTCAALVVFPDILVTEQAPWDPVQLLGRFENPALVVASMILLAIATLTTNIAANVVSPANDFSNLMPRLIGFRTGGMITALIGILIMPWKLLENADRYLTWLIGYSALLGPIAGILIADYYVVRRRRLELPELYKVGSIFGTVNGRTIFILLLAVLPNLPGFLATCFGVAGVPAIFREIFHYAWFVGFVVAFGMYAIWRPTRTSSTAIG